MEYDRVTGENSRRFSEATQQVEAQHQMWKVSQTWQTFQIWWYRMLTPTPEMTQFFIQSIGEIVQLHVVRCFQQPWNFEHSLDVGNFVATR